MAATMSVISLVLQSFALASLFSFHVDATDPRAVLTSMKHPITDGGIIAIRCQIWGMKDGYIVSLLHVNNGYTELITRGDVYMTSNMIYLSKRTFTDGSNIFFWTKVGASETDEGKYICKVFTLLDGSHIDIAEDSINIQLYSFPRSMYPECRSNPSEPSIMYENNVLRLTCTSEKAFPNVVLNWNCNNPSIRITPRNTTTRDMVSSEISFLTEIRHHGMVCVCRLSSRGFPDRQRSCIIGPITILDRNAVHTDNAITHASINEDIDDKQSILHSSNCNNNDCNSTNTVLYLILANMGASILSLTFLTTTIIWCCKYQSIADEINNAQQVSPDYGNHFTEPVYVSLQQRSACEREYMTVDDPNNPENKVVMPKEVFDEFYRTLSVKRV